jgi:hypothetical protein
MFTEGFFKFVTGFFGIILASFAFTIVLDHYATSETATRGEGASVFSLFIHSGSSF